MHRLLQSTRALFEPEPAVPINTSEFEKIVPVVQQVPAQRAIKNIANTLLGPMSFRHPLASREAMLGEIMVAYALRRSARRSIGFSVGPTGLAVSAPKSIALRDIDKVLQEKSAWILRKLHETRERQQRVEAASVTWQDGAVLPYLGGLLQLQTDATLVATVVRAAAPGELSTLAVASAATAAQIRLAVQTWLMRQAKPLFVARLDHFAPGLDVQWRKLSLSSAATRWGSASTSGAIRLNWRLMHFSPRVIDYVVVHELSHLRVMDHSPRFWATVRSVMPDYAALRAQLKDEAIPRW